MMRLGRPAPAASLVYRQRQLRRSAQAALCAARNARVPIRVNPPAGRWSVGVLRRLCADMNLHPDFSLDIKKLAYEGSIPRDAAWVRAQLLQLQALEAAVGLPPQSLLQHLARDPRMLAYVDQLWPRFQRLATLLDVPAERLVPAVAYCQAMLLRETEDVAAVVSATCSELRLRLPDVAEAVVAWPYLLLREPRSHAALCRRLRWYLDRDEGWSQELAALTATQLAVVLQADHAKLDRLEYLVASTRYKRRLAVGLLDALKPSDAAFAWQWPNFRSWCVQHNLVGTRGGD